MQGKEREGGVRGVVTNALECECESIRIDVDAKEMG